MSDDDGTVEIRFTDVLFPGPADMELAARLALAHIDIDGQRVGTALQNICEQEQGYVAIVRVLVAQTRLLIDVLKDALADAITDVTEEGITDEARRIVTGVLLIAREDQK